jgi:hypothetical protein
LIDEHTTNELSFVVYGNEIMRTIVEHGQVLMIPKGSPDEGPLLRSDMHVTK